MEAAFDKLAQSYDDDFTHSLVGLQQRRRVWDYLNKVDDQKTHLNILELNCGTGEDAIYLARMGHEICATDQSKEMLEMARSKYAENQLTGKIDFNQLDLNHAEEFIPNKKFDLIFSNFGGLNCIDLAALKKLQLHCKNWLKPKGSIIAVVMPRYTILELLYSLRYFKFKRIARRLKGEDKVNLNGNDFKTYFYNYQELSESFSSYKIENFKSIGLIPSYLNKFMLKHPKIFNYLSKLELKKMDKINWLNKSDHYLIHLMRD